MPPRRRKQPLKLKPINAVNCSGDHTTKRTLITVSTSNGESASGLPPPKRRKRAITRTNSHDDDVDIVIDSDKYSKVVTSAAFVDKSLHIKNLFGGKGNMKTLLISAPNRFGKSTNMNMVKTFLEIVMEKNSSGKWVRPKVEQTTNFKMFKSLKVYQCQCSPRHSENECKNKLCTDRNFFHEHCGKHPVIYLSLKDVECESKEELWDSLRAVLNETYSRHSYLKELLSGCEKENFDCYHDDTKWEQLSEVKVRSGLKYLAKLLHEQFGREVFILVDEFDAPISRLMHSDAKLKHIKSVMQSIGTIMSSILKSNDHVAGGYVNACVQVEHALSPYANNVNTYPFLENHLFSDYCGFTRKEVDELLQRPAFTGFCADAIGRHYNGYKIFGYNQDIYCTYSVLKYLFNWEECRKKKKDANLPSPPKEKHTPSHYWIESHGVGKLEHIFQIEEVRELIKKSLNKEVIDINVSGTKMSADQVLSLQNILNCVADPSTDQVHLLFLYLKDRGYFNVTEKTFFGLKLKIPNVEVRTELFKKLRNAEYTRLRKCFNGADINKYTDALIGLKINDPQTFQQLAESVATLFSKRPPRNHDEIQSPLYTFAANKWPVGSMHSEVLALEGRLFRMDLLFLRGGTGTIVEIKIGNQKLNSAENALKQIFDSHYYNAFYEKNSSKTKPEITKQKFFVGLNYNQGTVTICAWATEAKKVVTQWDKIPKDKLIRAKSSVSENEK